MWRLVYRNSTLPSVFLKNSFCEYYESIWSSCDWLMKCCCSFSCNLNDVYIDVSSRRYASWYLRDQFAQVKKLGSSESSRTEPSSLYEQLRTAWFKLSKLRTIRNGAYAWKLLKFMTKGVQFKQEPLERPYRISAIFLGLGGNSFQINQFPPYWSS